jgi:hypothetical protein
VNPKEHGRVHKNPPLAPTLRQMNSRHTLLACFPNIHYNIILPSIEVLRTSETSVYYNETTRRYIPESYHIFPAAVRTWKNHILVYFKWSVCFINLEDLPCEPLSDVFPLGSDVLKHSQYAFILEMRD